MKGDKISKLTKVILNDLKGKREVYQDLTKKNKKHLTEEVPYKVEAIDHSKYMPKTTQTEPTATKKPEPKKVSKNDAGPMKVEKEAVGYTVYMKNGESFKCMRLIREESKMILLMKDKWTEVSCNDIKYIKENRVRLLTIQP